MATPDELQLAFSHVEKLIDRRQSTTSFYLSVNTGIVAVIGLLVKDAQLKDVGLVGSVLLLLLAGLIACWIWRSLLLQYGILLDWWYGRLRELETAWPGSARINAHLDFYRFVHRLCSGNSDRFFGVILCSKSPIGKPMGLFYCTPSMGNDLSVKVSGVDPHRATQ